MPASLKNWIHSEVAIVTETIVSLAQTLLPGALLGFKNKFSLIPMPME